MNPLVQRLIDLHGMPLLDLDGADAFAAQAGLGAVLFPGHHDSSLNETGDVAVILGELTRSFPGLRGGVAAAGAERDIAARWGVLIYPSLALVRDGQAVAVFPKIKEWGEYSARIRALLAEQAA